MPSANTSPHPAVACSHAPARERVRWLGEPTVKGHQGLRAPLHAGRWSRPPCWHGWTQALARHFEFFL